MLKMYNYNVFDNFLPGSTKNILRLKSIPEDNSTKQK